MTLKDTDEGDWKGVERLAVGHALLANEPLALTTRRLADATGKDRSNVGRTVRALVDAGLLVPEPASKRKGAPGKQPQHAYRLADSHRAQLEAALEQQPEPGTLGSGLQFVLAGASESRLPALLEALSDPDAASQLAWSAQLDSSPQEYLLVFDGPTASRDANSLVSVLAAAGVPARRGSVGAVTVGPRFLREARQATDMATRTSIRRRTRQAAAG